MNKKYVSETEKEYRTPQELERIAMLRESRDVAKVMKPFILQPGEPHERLRWEVGKKIHCKHGNGIVSFREVVDGLYKYKVKVGRKEFEELSYEDIRPREIQDLSQVKVSEDIKSMATDRLLREFRSLNTFKYGTHGTLYGRALELKAELSKREHVPNKKEKQEIRRKTSKNKNKY